MTRIKIRNTAQLREAIRHGQIEYAVLLVGGVVRSSKIIELQKDGRFNVWNLVDDSVQVLTGRQLYSQSNIGKAMRLGALVTD